MPKARYHKVKLGSVLNRWIVTTNKQLLDVQGTRARFTDATWYDAATGRSYNPYGTTTFTARRPWYLRWRASHHGRCLCRPAG